MFSRFPDVFCFFTSLGFIVSWFIIVFLSFLFSVSISLLFRATYVVVMHAEFLRQRFFRSFAVGLFH